MMIIIICCVAVVVALTAFSVWHKMHELQKPGAEAWLDGDAVAVNPRKSMTGSMQRLSKQRQA